MSNVSTLSLREALGVSKPIRLAVIRSGHPKPEYIDIGSAYALIGRGAGCHVMLPQRQASFRHVYLQAFGQRVLCVDLLSNAGVQWDGPDCNGWLTPAHRVAIAGSRIQLLDDGWASDEQPWPSPLECKTRIGESDLFGNLPDVHLELTNRKLQGMSWPINRVMTLLGRDSRCRITCGDDRISRVHCSLLLTPSGLWVVDLLGRDGITVNGSRQSTALLNPGDELGVGQYRMRTVYESDPDPHAVSAPPDTTELPVMAAVEKDTATSAVERLPSPEFLTRNNRIFPVIFDHETIIVSPRGGIRTAAYQQMQLESNIITQLLATRPRLGNVIVDADATDAMDSIIISCVSAICRAAKKKAAICNCSPAMLQVLNDMSLTKVWPYFDSRAEALTYIQS